jgi:hypothetical protein
MYHVHRWRRPERGRTSDVGSEDDPRIKAAKCLLQSRLEDILAKTSADCHDKFAEFQYIPVADPAGDPIIRAAIRDCTERSMERISEGFNSLLALTWESQNNTRDTAADMAKMLTWEAIDQTFQWTAEDRGNLIRFREWQTRAIALGFARADDLLIVPPECTLQGANLAEFLHWHFLTRFERLLNQLRDEAFLNSLTAQSTRTAASSDSPALGVENGFVHSDDYRAVTVKGKKYNLTPNQARIFEKLYAAHLKRLPSVSTAALLLRIT